MDPQAKLNGNTLKLTPIDIAQQARALKISAPYVEAEVDKSIELVLGNLHAHCPANASHGRSQIRPQKRLGFELADALTFVHLWAGMSIANCPDFGGILIRLQPQPFKVAGQRKAGVAVIAWFLVNLHGSAHLLALGLWIVAFGAAGLRGTDQGA